MLLLDPNSVFVYIILRLKDSWTLSISKSGISLSVALQKSWLLKVTMPLFLHLADWWPEFKGTETFCTPGPRDTWPNRRPTAVHQTSVSTVNKYIKFYHCQEGSLNLAVWTLKDILRANTCKERCCSCRLSWDLSRSLCFVSIEFEIHLFPFTSNLLPSKINLCNSI